MIPYLCVRYRSLKYPMGYSSNLPMRGVNGTQYRPRLTVIGHEHTAAETTRVMRTDLKSEAHHVLICKWKDHKYENGKKYIWERTMSLVWLINSTIIRTLCIWLVRGCYWEFPFLKILAPNFNLSSTVIRHSVTRVTCSIIFVHIHNYKDPYDWSTWNISKS